MDATQALIDAVTDADVTRVRAALAAGASPNTLTGRNGWFVLTWAAGEGSTAIVQALLEAGAPAESVSGFDWSPLRAAATDGRSDTIRVLLSHGADPNRPSERASVLSDALYATRSSPSRGAVEAVRLLLDAGAALRHNEPSPIIFGVSRGLPSAALRMLLARGYDPNAARSDGVPAIVFAAMRQDLAAVDALIDAHAEVDATDRSGRTALMHAVERGADSIATSLLCAGADKNRAAQDGVSAQDLAQAWGRFRLRSAMGVSRVAIWPRIRGV